MYRFYIILTSFLSLALLSYYPNQAKNTTTHFEPTVSLKLSPKDSANPSFQLIKKRLDSMYKARVKLNNFNGCVLVAVKGKPIFVGSYGYANMYTKDTLKPQSSFQLASVSKTLTSSAILMLKDQGKLSLTDSVTKYYPCFPYKNVTIKDLLSHRSGLPNYLAFCNAYWKDKNMLLTNWHVMDIMCTYAPKAIGEPNKFFSYSNTNYVVLACIIEKVSGQSFKDYMETKIFQPLGMKNSFVFDFNYSTRSNITYGFDRKGNIDEFTSFDGATGDKGIFSSVEDMFIFDQALYAGKIVSLNTQKEAFTPLSFEKPSRKNYGLGWRMMQQPDNSYLTYHNGWWHSYHTLFHRFHQQQITVIVLSNRHDRAAYEVDDVYRMIYGSDVLLEADE